MRLFVALNLPPPVREALWAATARLRDLELPVKWVRGEGVHLTLKFLGDVADAQEGELAAALARAAAGGRALSLALGVTGDVRVRHHGEHARIEVEPRWVPWVTERLPAIRERLTALGFAVVEVDPRGYRRGSLLTERAGRA